VENIKTLQWTALSGNPHDLKMIDQYLAEFFSESPLKASDWTKVALAVNQFVADGILKGAVAFTGGSNEEKVIADGTKLAEEGIRLAFDNSNLELNEI
jgi:urocanate hydratase